MLRARAQRGTRLEQSHYGLLPAFLDGLLEAATPDTKVVDAFEMSYTYKKRGEFLDAYHLVKNRAMATTSVPDRYRALMRVGFGLWIDHAWRLRGWHTDPEEFSRNLRTPKEMEDALRTALEVSDEYVWLYSEQLNWWTGKNVPREYREAVRRARHAVQDIGSTKVLGRTVPPLTGRAKDQPGYDDKTTFGALWKSHDFVADLPKTWKFRQDPNDVGLAEKWCAAGVADADWQQINIGEWWEPQGIHYDGIAWYRVRFQVPESAEGRKLALSFGAVDESAWVYLNGKEIGKSDLGELGWDKRFEIALPADVTSDAENVLAVRVWDRTAYGGIWKSIKLVAEKAK